MNYIDATQRIAQNADQVELRAFRKLNASIDEGLVDEAISGESEDLMQTEADPQETEEWSMLDGYNDNQQGKILGELKTRSYLLGNLYPFDLKQSSLHYNSAKSAECKVYETFLLVSLTTKRQGRNWLDLIDSFERLSALVIKIYFQCSQTWWTGANANGGLQGFIEEIHKKTGELAWNPDPNFSGSVSRAKDAGLDFINYRNLIDSRPGGLFFYGQSACGDDWFAKTAHDFRQNRHRNIFRQPYADPVKIFTIPYLITSDHEKMLKAASNISGLVFDRARLTNVLSGMLSDKTVTNEILKIYYLAKDKCN